MYNAKTLLIASGVSGCIGAYIGGSDDSLLSQELAFLRRLGSYIWPASNKHLTSPELFLSKACAVTESIKYASLSTHNGVEIASRAVQPFKVEIDKQGSPTIYFNTNKLSRKYKEMTENSEVALTYIDQGKMACVTFVGKVDRIAYPESVKHWNDSLLMFYPEGNNENNGSRFSTWKITPRCVNLVSYRDGIASVRHDSRPPEVRFDEQSGKWQFECTGANEP